jgi:hypothetical protein
VVTAESDEVEVSGLLITDESPSHGEKDIPLSEGLRFVTYFCGFPGPKIETFFRRIWASDWFGGFPGLKIETWGTQGMWFGRILVGLFGEEPLHEFGVEAAGADVFVLEDRAWGSGSAASYLCRKGRAKDGAR